MKKAVLIFTMLFGYLQLIYPQVVKLDSSFGTNGIVNTDLGKRYVFSGPPAYQILLQSNGSMYVIEGNSLVKRGSDGYVDSSFRIDGFSHGRYLHIKNAEIQPNGKIVIVGFVEFGQKDFAIDRYNTDGTIDSSFSEDGEQTTDFGFRDEEPNSVAIQKDGKIVVAGISDGHLAIARYKTDGTLDKAFDGDGKLTNKSITGNSIAIQPDGKIVVAGSVFVKYDAGSGTSFTDFAVLRYNADGSLDNTFSADGIQTTDFNSGVDHASALVIQTDGKIVVAGVAHYYLKDGSNVKKFALARYDTVGNLDKSFSSDGKQITDLGWAEIISVALQSDKKIVVGGYNNINEFYFLTLARYNENGSIDKTFSKDGITSDFGSNRSQYNIAYSVAVQNDGKIVAGGTSSSRTAFVRYNTDGSPDSTFDGDGKLIDGPKGGYTIFRSVAVQKDGKIVAVGKTWNGKNFDFVIVRYNTNGTSDSSFNRNGTQTTDIDFRDDFANAVSIQEDGKILVAGYSGRFNDDISYLGSDSTVFSLARYNSDGSLDKTFDYDGKVQTYFGFISNNFYSALAIQNDGKIVVAGNSNNSFAVARYNTDGSLDNSLDEDGKQTFQFTDIFGPDGFETDGYATSVAINSDGKIVVAGVNGYVTLDAFSSIGILNKEGRLIKKINGTLYAISSAATILKDGKIALATNRYDEVLDPVAISIFTSDGNSERNLKGDRPKITDNYPGDPNQATSIAVQNNRIIVGVGSQLYIYNTDGGSDSTFGAQSLTFPVNSIVIADNRLYSAASAGPYNPNRTGYKGTLARYLMDNNNNTPPTVTLTTPHSNTTYLAPAAHIKLSAITSDTDGIITKVEFYNGTNLLHTETVVPYGFVWRNVPLGNYTLTAKAYDNSGSVTTSAPVHISVVPNKAPTVSVIKPKNNQPFAAPGYIHFEADAKDVDGRITRVEFYNGSTLLNTQYQYPYTFVWKDLPIGTYTITAIATDDWGAHTTSVPITFRVIRADTKIVSNQSSSGISKGDIKKEISVKLVPNPTTNILNIYTKGLEENKLLSLSLISATGVQLKRMQLNSSDKIIHLDVSSLLSGVYVIKLTSGANVIYKQLIKL